MFRDVEIDAPAASEAHSGQRVIAAIGIDRYRKWPRLSNAVNDARGAVKVFSRLGFEPLVEPLYDEAATADALRSLVTDDLAKLGRNDSVVLFFAGHGHTITRTFHEGDSVKTGYIIPADGDSPGGSTARWLRLDSWLSDVARLEAKHVLVFLDACHSGIALGSLIKWRDSQQRTEPLAILGRRRSRRVITSALDDQRAMDSGPVPGHSLFTGCLIEGLNGAIAPPGACVTGSQIGFYLQQRVTSYPSSEQTPDFGTLEEDKRGELILEIVAEQPPEPTALHDTVESLPSMPPVPSPSMTPDQGVMLAGEAHATLVDAAVARPPSGAAGATDDNLPRQARASSFIEVLKASPRLWFIYGGIAVVGLIIGMIITVVTSSSTRDADANLDGSDAAGSATATAGKPVVTAKLEMSSGRPRTILAFFPGTIEWIEASGKEVKANDVIMKLMGHKPLEAQVQALTREVTQLQANLAAAEKARDASSPSDEAAVRDAEAKVSVARDALAAKSEQLTTKTDQLEPSYVRLQIDGTLTVNRKVGETIPENTPIGTVAPAAVPSATFKIPRGMKFEIGMAIALKLGEKLITCAVADWEPEKMRIACEPGPDIVEGAEVSLVLSGDSNPSASRGSSSPKGSTRDRELKLEALLHDLQNGKTCAERKAAIAPIVELGHRRAIEPLRAARYRMVGGLSGISPENINACLTDEAEVAVKALSAPPVDPPSASE